MPFYFYNISFFMYISINLANALCMYSSLVDVPVVLCVHTVDTYQVMLFMKNHIFES